MSREILGQENPNNQFVQLEVDPRFATSGSVNLSGYTLRNNKGTVFQFPSGFVLQRDKPVRIFAGKGTDTQTQLYWGLAQGVWDSLGDCARNIQLAALAIMRIYRLAGQTTNDGALFWGAEAASQATLDMPTARTEFQQACKELREKMRSYLR